MNEDFTLPCAALIDMIQDARRYTLALMSDLSDEQLMVPQLDTINPPLWEIGHVAFFHEVFVLRELGENKSLLEGGEELFDSFEVEHDDRWNLLLPTREKMLDYMQRVLDRMVERVSSHEATPQETYLYTLATQHEDMHCEALMWTRQTLGYCAPHFSDDPAADDDAVSGDVDMPGGPFMLGAPRERAFVFDNEKWAHEVQVAPFRIARAPVTNREFIAFVEDDGYARPELWSYGGRMWREKSGATMPRYWKKENAAWLQQRFDQWLPLGESAAAIHINWYEAEAYCNWAGRRLPSEAEWEMTACDDASGRKRLYPWGDATPSRQHANVDGRTAGCVPVGAYADGDNAGGCRQMMGNVWEWTSSAFYPFPGYVVDHPYKEYSAPWFGYNKVLRGGSWATRARVLRNTYRNFALPQRGDVFAGFRTCAI